MTAQLQNIIIYKKEDYTIIQNSNSQPFHPKKLGIKVYSSSSHCRDGYISEYAINEDKLILENLFIDLKVKDILINGVQAVDTEDVFGRTVEATKANGELIKARKQSWIEKERLCKLKTL